MRELYAAVIRSLRKSEGRLPGSLRSVKMIAFDRSGESQFAGILEEQVERAIRDVAAASQDLLTLHDDSLLVSWRFR